jgi:hypothetical protein
MQNLNKIHSFTNPSSSKKRRKYLNFTKAGPLASTTIS